MADLVARSGLLDQLLVVARHVFFMVVPEVEKTGRIGAPYMMTIGPDGIDSGRLFTDRPEEMFTSTVQKRERPGVVGFTRGGSLFLVVMDVEGVLVRLEVPFSWKGRRFDDRPSALISDLFHPSYSAERVVRYLLPLEGASGADHDVDPSTLQPVLLPDAATGLQDMMRLQTLQVQIQAKGHVAREQPTGVFLAEIEEERRGTAPRGLQAVFVELTATLGDREGAWDAFVTRLESATSPLLAGLVARASLHDTTVAPQLVADPTLREKLIMDIRAAFAFVPGGESARAELVAILRQVFGDDPTSRAAVERMGRRLDLAQVAATFRGCVWMAALAGLATLVCAGLGIYQLAS